MAVDLKKLCEIEMGEPMDEVVVQEVLSSHPFILIPGSFNARDLSFNNPNLRQGFAFRTGSLENINEAGKVIMRDELNLRRIFDLRSLKERERFPAPTITGVEVVWVPNTLENPTIVDAQEPARKEFSLTGMYLDMLKSHGPAIKNVLTHVRDNPDQPFSFNCTAGKDRTAVVAFVLHSLAGSTSEAISLDYTLTRVGVEPVRDFLQQKLTGGRPIDLSDPIMKQLASVPSDAMEKLSRAVDEKYGGISGYVKSELEFRDEDLERIQRNLRA